MIHYKLKDINIKTEITFNKIVKKCIFRIFWTCLINDSENGFYLKFDEVCVNPYLDWTTWRKICISSKFWEFPCRQGAVIVDDDDDDGGDKANANR